MFAISSLILLKRRFFLIENVAKCPINTGLLPLIYIWKLSKLNSSLERTKGLKIPSLLELHRHELSNFAEHLCFPNVSGGVRFNKDMMPVFNFDSFTLLKSCDLNIFS